MKHKSFRQVTDLLAGHETYAEAYAEFLQTGDILPSLEEDIFRLQQHQEQANADEVHVHLSHTCMYIYMLMLNLACNVHSNLHCALFRNCLYSNYNRALYTVHMYIHCVHYMYSLH